MPTATKVAPENRAAPSPLRPGLRWLRETRCLFLMVSLIMLSSVYPFVHREPLLIVFTNSVVLLAGVYSVAVSRRRLVLAASVTAAQITTSIVYLVTYQPWAYVTSLILIIWAYGLTMLVVLRYVLRGHVTKDKLYGAVSVYFMIGITWSCFYRLLWTYDPTCIDGAQGKDLVYFSLITLATIGYGDLKPVSDLARVLSMLEGITGVFYVATLVARLVNAYEGSEAAEVDGPG